MQIEKTISMDVPYGVSNETVLNFLEEEAEKLREAEKEHVPDTGDVYECGGGVVRLMTMDGKNVSVGIGPGYCSDVRWELYKEDTFLGKFPDVYITKQRVREILTDSRDSDGDNVFEAGKVNKSNSYGVHDRIAAFAAEGITEIK